MNNIRILMKQYVKPETLVVDVVTVNVIATSFIIPDSGKDDIIAGSRKDREVWGDLWK